MFDYSLQGLIFDERGGIGFLVDERVRFGLIDFSYSHSIGTGQLFLRKGCFFIFSGKPKKAEKE